MASPIPTINRPATWRASTQCSCFCKAIRHTSKANGNQGNGPFGAYLLTRAALGLGDYEAARRYALEGYAVAKETGERWFLAYTLMDLGNVEFARHGRNHFGLEVPMVYHSTVDTLLDNGYRIDDFIAHFMSDGPAPGLSNYIITSPPFIL